LFYVYEINITYSDFVLAHQNSISTELPVVSLGQRCDDHLDSGSRLVQEGGDLISHQLVVSPDCAEHDDEGRSSGSAKVLILRKKVVITNNMSFGGCFHPK